MPYIIVHLPIDTYMHMPRGF